MNGGSGAVQTGERHLWKLYDELIASVSAADRVAKVHAGSSWVMVCTERGGIGVCAAHPCRSGRKLDEARFIGMPVREAAEFSKSWDFEEASMGVAAINAATNLSSRLPITENPDAFLRYQNRVRGKKVAVVGRFAYLEKRLAPICDLSVLERMPGPDDYPDMACEFLLPDMDAVFITGCTLSNKTLPRLLELSRSAFTALCGPSTTLSPILWEAGVDALCGFCIENEAACLAATDNCASIFDSGRMVCLEREEQ